MPLYSYRCSICGRDQDAFRHVDDRNYAPMCMDHYDSGSMERVVSAPMVMSDMKPYQSMIDGRMITSRSQHRDHLKSHGCIEIGNETKYLKPKEKIDLTSESRAARKQKIIEQVNHLKG